MLETVVSHLNTGIIVITDCGFGSQLMHFLLNQLNTDTMNLTCGSFRVNNNNNLLIYIAHISIF